VIHPEPSKEGIHLQSCKEGYNEVQKTCPGIPMWTRGEGEKCVVMGW